MKDQTESLIYNMSFIKFLKYSPNFLTSAEASSSNTLIEYLFNVASVPVSKVTRWWTPNKTSPFYMSVVGPKCQKGTYTANIQPRAFSVFVP